MAFLSRIFSKGPVSEIYGYAKASYDNQTCLILDVFYKRIHYLVVANDSFAFPNTVLRNISDLQERDLETNCEEKELTDTNEVVRITPDMQTEEEIKENFKRVGNLSIADEGKIEDKDYNGPQRRVLYKQSGKKPITDLQVLRFYKQSRKLSLVLRNVKNRSNLEEKVILTIKEIFFAKKNCIFWDKSKIKEEKKGLCKRVIEQWLNKQKEQFLIEINSKRDKELDKLIEELVDNYEGVDKFIKMVINKWKEEVIKERFKEIEKKYIEKKVNEWRKEATNIGWSESMIEKEATKWRKEAKEEYNKELKEAYIKEAIQKRLKRVKKEWIERKMKQQLEKVNNVIKRIYYFLMEAKIKKETENKWKEEKEEKQIEKLRKELNPEAKDQWIKKAIEEMACKARKGKESEFQIRNAEKQWRKEAEEVWDEKFKEALIGKMKKIWNKIRVKKARKIKKQLNEKIRKKWNETKKEKCHVGTFEIYGNGFHNRNRMPGITALTRGLVKTKQQRHEILNNMCAQIFFGWRS